MAREAVTETTKYTYTAPPLNREPVVRGELKHAKQRVPHEARGPEASIEQATAIYAIEHDPARAIVISDTAAMKRSARGFRRKVDLGSCSTRGPVQMSCLSTEVRSSRRPQRTPRRAGKPVSRQHAQVTEQPASLAAEQDAQLHTTPPTIPRPSARAQPKNAPPTTIHYDWDHATAELRLEG